MTNKLSLAEQETTITYAADEKIVHIDTSYPPDMAYYDKLCKARPDFIRLVDENDTCKFYEATKSPNIVRLKAPPKISEEERKAKSERAKGLAALRMAKSASNER